jgi:hypothetical protein
MFSRMLVGSVLATAFTVNAVSAQTVFPRDTINPQYARFADELPGLLSAVGLDSTMRAFMTREIETIARSPIRGRTDYPRSRTYLVTSRVEGHDAPLSLFVYWYDTTTVAVRVRSPDVATEVAVDSALQARRLARLVPASTIRIAVSEPEPYGGAEPGFIFTMTSPDAPHCPGLGLERRMRWVDDTLHIQVLGVAAPGVCPNSAGLRSATVGLTRPPGRYTIAFDSRGDRNLISLVVTDTSYALAPVRATYVQADTVTKWRYPSGSFRLRCNREAGDPRLCDAVHEFVLAQPGVVPLRSPTSAQFDDERVVVYRYGDESTADKIRRCLVSIPVQTRLDAWLRLVGRPVGGRWWAESPTGSSNSSTSRKAPAQGLDARGDIPPACGDRGYVATEPVVAAPRTVTTVPVRTFEFGRVNKTAIDARSDGWVRMTPLTSWSREPGPETHVFARAVDAHRWVQRVRDVLSGRAADRFVPSLGRGTAKVSVRVTDSLGYPRVSFAMHDCRSASVQYHVDGAALLSIAADVERAADIALRGSPVPVPPTLDHPYEADAVTCSAVAIGKHVTALDVDFVVDTAGKVEAGSITFPHLTPDDAEAVRAELMRRSYRPAELTGVKVRQVVHEGIMNTSPRS